MASMILWYLFI